MTALFENHMVTKASRLMRTTLLAGASLMLVVSLTACATRREVAADKAADFRVPNPKTPLDQFPVESSLTQSTMNFRANPQGLSENQRQALNKVAAKLNADDDAGRDIELIVNPDARSAQSAEAIRAYLLEKTGGVAEDHIQWINRPGQPWDVVTVNMIAYRSHVYDCNQSWENLSKTAKNQVYKNFGCAVNANIAAQIADPRDLSHPHSLDSADMGRRSTVLEAYRKGKDTATTTGEDSKVKISSAIQ